LIARAQPDTFRKSEKGVRIPHTPLQTHIDEIAGELRNQDSIVKPSLLPFEMYALRHHTPPTVRARLG
jgi:hypothetical protein